jgi:hypothetical protein
VQITVNEHGDLVLGPKLTDPTIIFRKAWGKWIRLNVVHDMGQGQVRIYVDGKQSVLSSDLRNETDNNKCAYFKAGVYAHCDGKSSVKREPSRSMSVDFKDIAIYHDDSPVDNTCHK